LAASASLPATGGLFKPRVSTKMHKKVEDLDVLSFFQQLSTLFRAGTPIYEAITIASSQCQSESFRVVIDAVARKVAAGEALNEALAATPEYFKTEWVQVIRSGEQSGKLGDILVQLVTQIDAANVMRSKLVSAMMYPCIMFSVSLVAVGVMLVKVVPTFAQMFDSMGNELPGITQGVLSVSDFLQQRGLLILGGLFVGWTGLRRYLRTPDGARNRDRLLVGLPLVGEVMVQSCMQKFALNTALLLRSGLPLLEAIQAMRGIFTSNFVYEGALGRVEKHVERGGAMADGLEQTGVFTTFVVSMCRIGEESGTLPDVLDEVELFYRRKVETLVERVTGSLETVVIIFMGVAVAVILCSVYLPMFSMAGGVG
jgi:type IV pilus assembly protein PilC